MVTTKSQLFPGTHSWVLPSWCSIIPGHGDDSRRLRCAPRLGARFTTPASCSLFFTKV